MTTDPLSAYHTWRASLSPEDRTRWAYLLQDAEPLIVDVIKAQVANMVSGPFAGVETTVADALVSSCAEQALRALLA